MIVNRSYEAGIYLANSIAEMAGLMFNERTKG